jgi:hypothetical protein
MDMELTPEVAAEFTGRMQDGMWAAIAARLTAGVQAGADVLAATQRDTADWLFEGGHITLEQHAELLDQIGRGYDDYLASNGITREGAPREHQ